MKADTSYFSNTLTNIKSYILGLVINNIEECYTDFTFISTLFENSFLNNEKHIIDNLLLISNENPYSHAKKKVFQIVSKEILTDILRLTNNNVPFETRFDSHEHKHKISKIEITCFVENNSKEIANQFLTAFFEKKAFISCHKNNNNICIMICDNNEKNLETFSNFYEIPCEKNKETLTYIGSNALDLIGLIYNGINNIQNKSFYNNMINSLGLDSPILKWKKINNEAITPIKANYSDVGYDLTAIGISKEINKKTILCNTGIKLDIPPTYYVEIVPRSSIIKSGYMLANSIGIIDCSYKGELLIALTKIDDSVPDISFPFRCCQLIMKKQVYPTMVEVDDVSESKRGYGGFGSSG